MQDLCTQISRPYMLILLIMRVWRLSGVNNWNNCFHCGISGSSSVLCLCFWSNFNIFKNSHLDYWEGKRIPLPPNSIIGGRAPAAPPKSTPMAHTRSFASSDPSTEITSLLIFARLFSLLPFPCLSLSRLKSHLKKCTVNASVWLTPCEALYKYLYTIQLTMLIGCILRLCNPLLKFV